MTLTYSYADGREINFKHGIPSDYEGHILKGAVAAYATGINGNIFVQEYGSPFFIIRLQEIKWRDAGRLRYTNFTRGLHMQAVLRNFFHQSIKGAGEQFVRTNELSACMCDEWTAFIEPHRHNMVQLFEIIWSPMFFELLPREGTDLLRQKAYKGIPTLLGEPYRLLNREMRQLTERLFADISNNNLGGNLISLVKQLLVVALQELQKPVPDLPRLRPSRLEKLRDVRDYLTICENRPSIASVANKFDISPHHLKKYFPLVTGRTLIHYWQYCRCLHARKRIIENNEPLKAIYTDAGYNDIASFICGFNRYLCCNPGELMRNKWNLDAVKPGRLQ
jgi:AraC-like DNA-binding protein